ncbi:MAG: LacI family DNA-binding transcriptional regulator [Chloroflexota bacterium]
MRITIRDVAARSGVSVNTVSRVINGRHDVNSETRARVQGVIDELGFRPNGLARSLLSQQTRTLGHIVTDCTNPNTAQQLRALHDVAFADGYGVMLFDTNEREDRQVQALQILEEQRVAGIVMTPVRSDTHALDSLRRRGTHLVLVNRELDDLVTDCVLNDDAAGSRAAVEHLMDLGHTRIAYITAAPGVGTARSRVRGFEAALHDRGVRIDPALIMRASIDPEAAAESARALMQLSRPPTAIMTHNDLMAVGVFGALKEMGLAVPGDVALVGYDDILYARYLEIPLTTVAQETRQMGEAAARLLLARIAGEAAPPRRIVFTPRLVVRASSRVA